jgi:hypothetical protein
MQTRIVTVDEDGHKVRKPVQYPVRHWYWRDHEGKVRFCIRVFNKRLEIEKGKTDIIVGKDKDLPALVKSLLDAANAGEFDLHLKQAIAQRQKQKSK